MTNNQRTRFASLIKYSTIRQFLDNRGWKQTCIIKDRSYIYYPGINWQEPRYVEIAVPINETDDDHPARVMDAARSIARNIDDSLDNALRLLCETQDSMEGRDAGPVRNRLRRVVRETLNLAKQRPNDIVDKRIQTELLLLTRSMQDLNEKSLIVSLLERYTWNGVIDALYINDSVTYSEIEEPCVVLKMLVGE